MAAYAQRFDQRMVTQATAAVEVPGAGGEVEDAHDECLGRNNDE